MPVKAGSDSISHPGYMANGATPKSISLLPREHGAYAQLGVSLAAGLALAPASPRAWAQGLATILVFLATEPLLVLLGRRGEAARSQGLASARRRLAWCGSLLLMALALAWNGATLSQRLSVLPGLSLGLALLGLFLARREHTMTGELLAAGAFSFAALPVSLLGGALTPKALAMALSLTALHGTGTLLVRGFLDSLKPGSARAMGALPILLGLALGGGVLLSPLPWPMTLAPAPLTAAALWVYLAPPSPREMRRVGWILTAASALPTTCR